MKIDGLNKFKIAGISKKVNEKNSDISFDLPDAIKINSEYSLSGTVGKKKLKGEGNIRYFKFYIFNVLGCAGIVFLNSFKFIVNLFCFFNILNIPFYMG